MESVEVLCRIKPSAKTERKRRWTPRISENNFVSDNASIHFDRIYDETSQTQRLTDDLKRKIERVIDGFSLCVAAYGHSGSGKTHTMCGNGTETGLMQQIVDLMISKIKSQTMKTYLLKAMLFEVYNEKVFDLLDNKNMETEFRLRESAKGGLELSGANAQEITSVQDLEKMLTTGMEKRRMAATNWNERSSRSHIILHLTVESESIAGEALLSTLQLVDLAGSEGMDAYSSSSNANSRREEGRNINRSLSTFVRVVQSLNEKHTPFRESKLTRLLQSSLSNAQVSIICTVDVNDDSATSSTLNFARSAKLIKVEPRKTKLEGGAGDIEKLKRLLAEKESELSELKKQKASEEFQEEKMKKINEIHKLFLTGSVEVQTQRKIDRRASWGGGQLSFNKRPLFSEELILSKKQRFDDAPKEVEEEEIEDDVFKEDEYSIKELLEDKNDQTMIMMTEAGVQCVIEDEEVMNTIASLRSEIHELKQVADTLEKEKLKKDQMANISIECHLEDQDHLTQISILREEIEQLKSKIVPKKDLANISIHCCLENEDYEGKITCLQSEIDDLRTKIVNPEDMANISIECQIENDEITRTISSLQEEIEELKAKINPPKDMANISIECNFQNEDLESMISKLQAEVESLKAQIVPAKDMANMSIICNIESEEITETISSLQAEIEELKSKIVLPKDMADISLECDLQKEDFESTISKLQAEIEGLKEKIVLARDVANTSVECNIESEEITETIASLRAEIEELKSKIAPPKDIANISIECNLQSEDFGSTVSKLQDEIENLKGQIMPAKDTANMSIECSLENDSLQATISNLQSEIDNLKANEVAFLAKKATEDEENQKTMIDISLECQLENEDQKATISSLNAQIDELKKEILKHQEAFTGVSKEYQEMDAAKVVTISSLNEEIDGLKAAKMELEQKLMLIEDEKKLTESIPKPVYLEMESQCNLEDEASTSQITTLQSEISTLNEKIKEAEREKLEMKNEQESLREEIVKDIQERIETQWQAEREALRQANIDKKRLEARIQTLVEEQQSIHAVVSDEETEALKQEIEQLKRDLLIEKEKTEERTQVLERLMQDKSAFTTKLSFLQSKLENKENLVQQLTDQLQSNRQDNCRMREEFEKIKKQKDSSNKEVKSLMESLKMAEEADKGLEAKIKELNSEILKAKREVEAANREKKAFISEIRESDVKHEMAMNKLRAEIAKIVEENEKAIDQIKSELHQSNQENDAEKAKLKREIEALLKKCEVLEAKSYEIDANKENSVEKWSVNEKEYSSAEQLVERIIQLEKQRENGLRMFTELKKELEIEKGKKAKN